MNRRVTLLALLTVGIGLAVAAEVKTTPNAETKTATPAPASTPAAKTPPAAAPRNDSSVAPVAPFETFRLITDRNIFNPNRTGRRERTVEEAPPRLDIITLVGTMDSDKGLRAFFDGSNAAYRKALHVGDSVEKFKVTKIEPKVVELEHEGKTLSVNVGQQLRRPEGAEWTLSATEVQPRAGLMASPSRPDPNAPVEIPANADDVTRRLMERRAKSQKN